MQFVAINCSLSQQTIFPPETQLQVGTNSKHPVHGFSWPDLASYSGDASSEPLTALWAAAEAASLSEMFGGARAARSSWPGVLLSAGSTRELSAPRRPSNGSFTSVSSLSVNSAKPTLSSPGLLSWGSHQHVSPHECDLGLWPACTSEGNSPLLSASHLYTIDSGTCKVYFCCIH